MFRNQYDNDAVTLYESPQKALRLPANILRSSPQGRIFQVEYAQEAVKQGSVVVGVVSKKHAVLAALKVGSISFHPVFQQRSHYLSSETPRSFLPIRRRSFP